MSQKKSELIFPHKKIYQLELSPTISFCYNCSSVILTDTSGKTKSSIKPLNYHSFSEINNLSFLPHLNSNKINKYPICKDIIKIRVDYVKQIKQKCSNLRLSLPTYFLALDYFDQICSIFTYFSEDDICPIVDICIILAAKINERKDKAMKTKLYLVGKTNSDKYIKDEEYILSKLNFDLVRITCYDILRDAMKTGFVFEDEEFDPKKLNSIYAQMENMLFLFSEKKHYIRMSPKEIAMGIVGLSREILGLNAFNENIQFIFMGLSEFDDSHIYNYVKCLNKIRKCFKIQIAEDNENENNNNNNVNNINNNHSDSTKDSNSDNN